MLKSTKASKCRLPYLPIKFSRTQASTVVMGTTLDEATSAKVLRQVEFYFSDSNLPRDKFLQQCIKESDDGLVSLPLICSFKRMRSHLGLKEAGPDKVPLDTTTAVADVLRKSTNLKFSDDGKKVGPRTMDFMSEEGKAAVDARSVAVGPLCWTKHLEELETFFSLHMQVKSVRLPRHPNQNVFCGFAVVELVSEDEAKKALELKLTYDGVELEIKTRKDLDDELEKAKVERDTPSEQLNQQPSKHKNTRHDVREESYPKGLIVAFSLQKRVNEGACTIEVSKGASAEDAKEQVAKEEVAGISSKQVEEGNEITREDLKEVLNKYGTVKFLDYSRGATSGFIRFENAEAAHKARGAAVLAEEGGLIVKDHLATLEALEGEAEKVYWAKIRGAQDNVRAGKHQHHRKNDRFGGRGKKQQHDNNYTKPEGNSNLGKHKRFEEDDSVDEHFTKQAKS